MIVAIDGPAGTGKGTIASLISKRLNFTYIDTGAMYRAVGLYVLRKNISTTDNTAVSALLDEINIDELKNKNHVAIGSGASTPSDMIDKLAEILRNI